MAAPTYFGSASTPADNGTQGEPNTVAVTPPASMVSGDLVLLIGAHRLVGDTITLSAAGGQTWTDAGNAAGTGSSFHLWWCQFNGTWGANPSLAFAAESGTIPVSVVMHVFRPSTVGTWLQDTAISFGSLAAASPQPITGITPNKRDNITLAGWLQSNIATWGTLSGTGWVAMSVAQWRNSTGSDISLTFAHQLQATPAATNNVSQTPSTGTTGTKFTMAWYNSLTPPTIALNTADATAFGADTTPTVEFTGTDGNADDVRYNMQIDTVSTFDSLAISNPNGSINAYDVQGGTGAQASQAAAQPITSIGAVSVGSISIKMKKVGSPTDNLTVALRSVSETGSILGQATILGSTLTTSLAIINFDFGSPASLSAATQYFIVVERSGANDATNYYQLDADAGGNYGGGRARSRDSNVWVNGPSNDDLYFIVYVSLLDKLSGTDAGFLNTVSGGDTDPFNSGEKASYTVQAGSELVTGTYYWRARAKDPNGGNTYSSWATARTFTIATATSIPNKAYRNPQAVKRASFY